jgi:Ser/Thr protein kinase RdoA (MazF antagonist)
MLWMEGVPGGRARERTPRQLRAMVEAVAGMHRAMRRSILSSVGERRRQLVSAPLETLAQYGDSAAVRQGCAGLAAKATDVWLDTIPVIPQHGDLFVDNLLTDGKSWHVVDWESFGSIDLPSYDLFTLLLSVLGVEGETPDGWKRDLAAEIPGLVANYVNWLELNRPDIGVLLPLSLANWFHLQWSDGRVEFAARMYRKIQHYFERPEQWNRVFGI